MEYFFTAAAERVLNHAAAWLDTSGFAELDARSLLLGLLEESECRAANLLTKHGVDIQAVCEVWGESDEKPIGTLTSHESTPHFDRDLTHAIREVYAFALEFEKSPILATEHLLLSLFYSECDIARWLTERGMDRCAIEADIRKRSGFDDTLSKIDAVAELEAVLEIETTKEPEVERLDVCMQEFFKAGQPRATLSISVEQTPSDAANIEFPSVPSIFSPSSVPILRILDAAGNRAREGLRAIEDFLRFVTDDRFLTDTAKQLRHELVAAMQPIPATDLLASRETQADVGIELTSAAEASRADLSQVLAANFGRLEESLRSLEEYGKLFDPAMGAAFKRIRYRIYTLERGVQTIRQSSNRLAGAKLYVLIDGCESLEKFREMAETLISSGVHIVQLRDKRLDDRRLLERARLLREIIRDSWMHFREQVPFSGQENQDLTDDSAAKKGGVPLFPLFIMNDRPDLAVLSQADGVHLGQDELSVKDARTIVGPQAIIGISTHNIEQARQAVLDGANYIGVGPTFPSTTKEFSEYTGLELLHAAAAEIRLPSFAIGGITLENFTEVLATGIDRVAVSGAIVKAKDPRIILQHFNVLLSGGTRRKPG